MLESYLDLEALGFHVYCNVRSESEQAALHEDAFNAWLAIRTHDDATEE